MAPVNEAVPEFSDLTLSRTPGKSLTFLGYAGRTPAVYAALKKNGFTQADLQEGWTLLLATGGYVAQAPDPVRDQKTAASLAFVDAWDEPNFRRLRAGIRRKHPAAEEVLFGGLTPGVGTAAILSVTTLLDRVDKLKEGPHAAALATLEQRGLTPRARAELREHITIAKGMNPPEKEPETGKQAAECQRKKLLALKMWFDDWAETARTSGLSRYHLINLGLAKRKKSAKNDAVEEFDEDFDEDLDETA